MSERLLGRAASFDGTQFSKFYSGALSPATNPDDAMLTELKTYEVFPKSEAWINAALAKVLAAEG